MPSIDTISMKKVDLVLGYGPHNGSMQGLASLVHYLKRESQDLHVAWWLLENLPNGRFADVTADLGAAFRLWGDRAFNGRLPGSDLRFLQQGQRWRILGEIKQLCRRGVIDSLISGSSPRAEFLQRRGIDSLVVPFGFSPEMGQDLALPRDVDVAFLGNRNASRRRRRILSQVSSELKKTNREIVFPRGYLGGNQRTEFLNRCKIVLNVLKSPRDSVGHRFLLCAGNGAMIVSEPNLDNEAFVSGRDFVTSQIGQIAETVEFYLQMDSLRHKIAETASHFVHQELTLKNMLSRILQHVKPAPTGTKSL
ncbi:glycosyltransferase family protein [Thalassoglobus sp.]|uniref:glycosyltransferase family protein n=1 Tax=Thalassoglobus sp. TaxID=2795869 RepID=UPI003AA8A100